MERVFCWEPIVEGAKCEDLKNQGGKLWWVFFYGSPIPLMEYKKIPQLMVEGAKIFNFKD